MSEYSITRRRLLGGLATVGAAGAVGGAGTYAWISDENSVSTSFTAGDVDLSVDPTSIEFPQDDDSVMSETITLTNTGTLDAGSTTIADLQLEGASDLQAGARIETLGVEGDNGDVTDVLPPDVTDHANENSWADLADLAAYLGDGNVVDLDASLPAGGANSVTVKLEVDFEYEVIETNGGSLSAEFGYVASQR